MASNYKLLIIGFALIMAFASAAAIVILPMLFATAFIGVLLVLSVTAMIGASSRMSERRPFDIAVFIAFASLGFVRWEPSIFDLFVPCLLLFGLLSGALRFSSNDVTHRYLVVVSSAFCIVQLTAVAMSPFLMLSLRYALITIMLVGSSVLIYLLAQNEAHLRTAISGLLAGAVLSTILSIVIYQGFVPGISPSFVTYSDIRLMGLFKDSNVLSPYLIFCFMVAATQFLQNDKVQSAWNLRLPLLGMLFIFAYAILIAYSRAAWLNAIATFGTYGALRVLRFPRKVHIYALIGLVVLALGFAALQVPAVNNIVSKRQFGLEAQDQRRFATQERSWIEFSDSPLALRGPGASARLLRGIAPHNVYLQQMYETGAWGIVLFLAFIVGALYFAIKVSITSGSDRHAKLAAACAATLIGLAVNSLFIDSIHWRHLWLIIGLGWGAIGWRFPSSQEARPVNASVRVSRHPALGQVVTN